MKTNFKSAVIAGCCIVFTAWAGFVYGAEAVEGNRSASIAGEQVGGETVLVAGVPAHTSGKMVEVGQMAPDFKGANAKREDIALSSFKGKKVILNIFPSIDTKVCALSVRQFNAQASGLENTVVLCLSMDLPFAQSRFCAAEGLENVVPLSLFRSPEFVKGYGLQLVDSPMRGLMARAVIVIDEAGRVCYTELVHNISNEPDYEAALKAVRAL